MINNHRCHSQRVEKLPQFQHFSIYSCSLIVVTLTPRSNRHSSQSRMCTCSSLMVWLLACKRKKPTKSWFDTVTLCLCLRRETRSLVWLFFCVACLGVWKSERYCVFKKKNAPQLFLHSWHIRDHHWFSFRKQLSFSLGSQGEFFRHLPSFDKCGITTFTQALFDVM